MFYDTLKKTKFQFNVIKGFKIYVVETFNAGYNYIVQHTTAMIMSKQFYIIF